MNLEHYKISFNPLGRLECTQVLDFKDYPILTVERAGEQHYLSYLVTYLEGGFEQRLLVPISSCRLLEVQMGTLSVREALSHPEGSIVYALHCHPKTEAVEAAFIIPSRAFEEINPVAADYTVFAPPEIQLDCGDAVARTMAYAKDRHRVMLDLYVQGASLINGVKPWTIHKVFVPALTIIQEATGLTDRDFNQRVSFPRLKAASFDVTIELDNVPDLFERGKPEFDKLGKLVSLFESETKEDIDRLISQFRDEAFIKEYIKVIRAIRKYNLTVTSTLVNPSTNDVAQSVTDRTKADKIKIILDEKFPEIISIDEVEGVFLVVNCKGKAPSFAVQETDTGDVIRGKIGDDLIAKLTGDYINIKRNRYLFKIRAVYRPETTMRPESTRRTLLDYVPAEQGEANS